MGLRFSWLKLGGGPKMFLIVFEIEKDNEEEQE